MNTRGKMARLYSRTKGDWRINQRQKAFARAFYEAIGPMIRENMWRTFNERPIARKTEFYEILD